MPKDAMILSVQLQGNNIVLWASVMKEGIRKERVFELLFTGEEHDFAFMAYFGTVQVDDTVVHVFEQLHARRVTIAARQIESCTAQTEKGFPAYGFVLIAV